MHVTIQYCLFKYCFFMKKISLFVGLILIALSAAGSAFASYGEETCQPIYGGGQTCITTNKFFLNKKVLHPTETKGDIEVFVDNLSINDPKYGPNQTVKFQLIVKNTGNTTLNELTLTDILPSYVIFVSGPGTYNTDSKTLTFKITNLNPGETRISYIETKVVDPASLPSGQGTVCVVNQASLILGSDESKDNSQFCIEIPTKGGFQVLGAPNVKQTPATGPEMLPLFGLIPAGLSGLFLRRKASK